MTSGDIINGRYCLVRSIGRGSFGEVWLATDQTLGLDVAIKIYIALDTRGLSEFKNEFKSVYNLHHPNLLRADYFDSVGSSPYLVMPYCPVSVGDKVGSMTEAEIWAFIKGVADGLTYLHANDIVHRDIKPDNILRDEQGNYVISDFGLSTKMRSTLRKASARNNESPDQSGTIGYMAPEMFSARPNAVKATDIWAFGATIYELATGDMPFCGQGGVMELHGAELPDLDSRYSAALTDLMHRCLAKEPWDRPSAAEISKIAAANGQGESKPSGAPHPMPAAADRAKDEEIADLKMRLQAANDRAYAARKAANSASDATPKKSFKVPFWITLGLLVVTIILSVAMIYLYWEESEAHWNSYCHAQNTISEIDNICQGNVTAEPVTYPAWTSSNHANSSVDYYRYGIDGREGDVLKFDYFVDSESYDHFIATIMRDGSEKVLKDMSGSNKSGTVTYVLPADGSYTLEVKYQKDGSESYGRDKARVSDLTLKSDVLSHIKRLIREYNGLYNGGVEYVAEEAAEEAVEVVDSIY